MTDMRDKIADILRGGQLQHIEEDVMADAILAALPDMIAPLVWDGVENDGYATSGALGHSYELVAFDTLDRHCDYVWKADVSDCNADERTIATPAQSSFKQAQAAANTHHRAAIMAAFTGDTK
jgi:hypothetical protein